MRKKLFAVGTIALLALILVPSSGVFAQRRPTGDSRNKEMAEREEIDETYELAPGARVELSVISGPVEVETTSGSTAQVHIVRMGETRTDLDCYKIAIDHSPNSLVMRHRQEKTDECGSIRAGQQVTLRLPRNVSLKLNAISGPVKIVEIDGDLKLSGISGRVEVVQAMGYSEISGISGVLQVTIPRLSERGIRVSGISGRVELLLAGDLNADLSVSGINGEINSAASNVTLNKVGHSNFRGRVGAGGSAISVSGISGDVNLRN